MVGHMEMPREVLQHIFTVKGSSGEPVLALDDRVRCLGVCRAWREHLNPASWPLQQQLWISWGDFGGPITPWALHTQPAARSVHVENYSSAPPECLAQLCSYLALPHPELRELALEVDSEWVRALWPAVCALPGLTALQLSEHASDASGESSALSGSLGLASLPSTLENLYVCTHQQVQLRAPGPLLPALTRLVLSGESGSRPLEVNATLPSLRELLIDAVGQVDLAGASLALPQLTRLDVMSMSESEEGAPLALSADFRRLLLLARLRVICFDMEEPSISSFASLAHLTWLAVQAFDPESEAAVFSLLQQAPATLQHLYIAGCAGGSGSTHALPQLKGLVSLSGDSTAQVLPLLGSVAALRELEVRLQGGGSFGLHLSGLTQLTKLTANSPSVLPLLAPLSNLRELCLFGTSSGGVLKVITSMKSTSQLAALPRLRKLEIKNRETDMQGFIYLRSIRAALPSCEVIRSNERSAMVP